MITNFTLFWCFNFSKCLGRNPNMFSRPSFQTSIRLTVIRRIAPSALIFIIHSRHKLEGKRSLNWKTLASFLWLLKTTWSLQKFKMPLKDFLNLVFVCKEISPRYGSDIIKVFFPTVVTWGHFMTNLLIMSIMSINNVNNK